MIRILIKKKDQENVDDIDTPGTMSITNSADSIVIDNGFYLSRYSKDNIEKIELRIEKDEAGS